jgi:hypothetical protein
MVTLSVYIVTVTQDIIQVSMHMVYVSYGMLKFPHVKVNAPLDMVKVFMTMLNVPNAMI